MSKSKLAISPRQAGTAVGIAFITSVLIVTLVDDFLLANFVVPGDTEALARDIAADQGRFTWAAVGYLLVLTLDSIIGLALYIVLKPANQYLALLTSGLRLLYAVTLAIGVVALAIHGIDAYGYASIKMVGYVFFALHILVLGYAVFRSRYIPRGIGVLLMLASLTYAVFFVDFRLSETWLAIIMLIMAVAELSLSIWLIVKKNNLPENDR